MEAEQFAAKYGPWALIAGASEGTGASFARQLAEPVDQFGGEALKFDLGGQARQPPVKSQPHIQIGNVCFGNQNRHAQIDLRSPLAVIVDHALQFARLDLGDRVFQHGLIKLESHVAHLAGLFLAQQVARTANIKILRRQRKACP